MVFTEIYNFVSIMEKDLQPTRAVREYYTCGYGWSC